MDIEEIRRNSINSIKNGLRNVGVQQNESQMMEEEELLQKVETVEQLINYQLDLFGLKEDVCELFIKLKDDIASMISDYEIEIMSKINKIEKTIHSNSYVQEFKRELSQLKSKNTIQKPTPRQQSMIDDLTQMGEMEFVKRNFSKILQRMNKVRERVYMNVEEITKKISETTKGMLDDIDYNEISRKYVNIFEDVNRFKGQLCGEIIGGEEVYCICKLQDKYFLTTSKPNLLKLYNIQEDSLCKYQYQCPYQPRSIIQVSNDKIVVGTEEGSIYVFKFDATSEELKLVKTITQKMMLWDICKINQTCLATVSFCGKLQMINYLTGKTIKTFQNESSCFVNIKNINSEYLCISSSKIQIINKTTFEVAYEYQNDEMGYVFALERLDQKRIAFGGTDCKIRIWNYKTNTIENVLHNHSKTIYQIKKLSKHHIVSCSDDGKFIIWDLSQTNSCILITNSHLDSTYSLEIFSNYNMIITGGKENVLKFWK